MTVVYRSITEALKGNRGAIDRCLNCNRPLGGYRFLCAECAKEMFRDARDNRELPQDTSE